MSGSNNQIEPGLNGFVQGPWNVTRATYHADRECDSHSSLEVFRRSVPTYHATFVTGEMAQPGGNEAMDFGTAFHALLLEPETFDGLVAVQPQKWDLRTNAGKAAMAEFTEAAGARVILTAERHDSLRRMADAVLADPCARELLRGPGPVERAVRWVDPVSGLKVRNLFDKVLAGGPTVDVKTAANATPEAWARDATNYGYHRQAALYQYGREQAFGDWCDFLFVVVGKDFPHEVAVYQLNEEAMDLARNQNAADMAELKDRKDYDDWRGRQAGQVTELALPRYAFY